MDSLSSRWTRHVCLQGLHKQAGYVRVVQLLCAVSDGDDRLSSPDEPADHDKSNGVYIAQL